MKEAALRRKLRTKYFGRTLYFFDSVSSTNDYAKTLAEQGAPEGTLVVADTQTAGRGSGNRSWLSPPRTGIWLSCALTPSFHPSRVREAGILAAYSVAAALREKYAVPVMLKWPNDIILGGKKIGGLLSEACAAGDTISCLVIGLGLNVNTRRFPPELQDTATSLFLECRRLFDRAELIADYLERIEKEYDRYTAEGSLEHIVSGYDALLIHRGRHIRLLNREKESVVFSEGINRFGELRVRDPGGNIKTVGIGEVSVRGLNGYI
jgi:BirA family biotin operon repressor/biotin-[acetyl-CoA-carboxylase] ligase